MTISPRTALWPLLRLQVLESVGLVLLAVVGLLGPPLIGNEIPTILVAAAATAFLIRGLLGARRLAAVRLAETAAVPLATAAVLASTSFSPDLVNAAAPAALLLLAERLGRIGETIGRQRSQVQAAIEGTDLPHLADSWRDNSRLAAGLRRLTLVLEWARFPLAATVASLVWLWGEIGAAQVLLAGAAALLAINPRGLRMATGDAHLSLAISAAKQEIRIRDAHVVGQVAQSRIAAFMASRTLVTPEPGVIQWLTVSEADEESVLAALAGVEAKFEGDIARAISAFAESRKIVPAAVEEWEHLPGVGVSGMTVKGHIFCGSRELLLRQGISTGLGESEAHNLEQSGRRALFVALNGQLAAVFGLEETPVSAAGDAIRQITRLGLDAVMITSVEVEAAQALAARMAIDHVKFQTPEANLPQLLADFNETGENVILVGSGKAFEESLISAAAAIALRETGSTQAGIHVQSQEITHVAWIIEACRRAQRNATVNVVAACAATAIGFSVATGWQTPLAVAFAGLAGFSAAAASTWNGPFALITRFYQRLDAAGRWLRKFLDTRKVPGQRK